MLMIHGRTRAQFYTGRADWRAIRAVANLTRPPASGGQWRVIDAASARAALEQSGADAVMVGRGAQGAPWKLAEIAHALWGTPAPQVPQGAALAEAVAEHYEDIMSLAELGRVAIWAGMPRRMAPNRANCCAPPPPEATLEAIRARHVQALPWLRHDRPRPAGPGPRPRC